MTSNARRRELYRRNKKENPERIKKRLEKSSEWRKVHKKKMADYRKTYIQKKGIVEYRNMVNASTRLNRKLPWVKTYYAIYSRLARSRNLEKWGNKYRCYVGIEMYMTPTDLKMLWERDNAENLISPSIDRKNSKDHYTVENCQYIEMKINRAKVINQVRLKED